MLKIIIAILILSVIIIVHEFGHFILAKANGIMVLEFSLGFGPKLIHFKKGETEYCLKLFPFGGACMMLGEDFIETDEAEAEDEETENAGRTTGKDEDEKNTLTDGRISAKEKNLAKGYDMSRAFVNQSVWARISVIAAGPIFNFILAFIISVFIIGFYGYDPSTLYKVYDDSPAAAAGLQEGDRIVELNGRSITFSREVTMYKSLFPDETLHITYVRDGQKYTTTVEPEHTTSTAYRIGITITENAAVGSVTDHSPAKKAGMKINDVIKSVNGTAISTGDEFSQIVTASEGNEVSVVVDRDGQDVTLSMTPELTQSENYYVGFVCYSERQKASPANTFVYSFKEVGYWIRTVFDSLRMLVTGKLSLNDMAGPVGVVNVIGQVVDQSKTDGMLYVVLSLLNMTVMITANLGVMNLLPLPALDGGRLVFLIIEALRGKPVSRQKEGMVHFVGMVLLMILMVVIMFNDVRNIFF